MSGGSEKGFRYPGTLAVRIAGRCARSAAVVSAFFVFGLAVLTVSGWLQLKIHDPLEDRRFEAMRDVLRQEPGREDVKAQIREMDFAARRVYFASQAHVRGGIRLIAAGLVVLVLSAGIAAEAARRLPNPWDKEKENAWRSMGRAWQVMAAVAVLAGTGGIAAGMLMQRYLADAAGTQASAGLTGGEAGAVKGQPVPDEELIRHWPGFLGPSGRAIAGTENAPAEWNYSTGTGLLWKAKLDSRGYSSPIAWSNSVFLAQADEQVREIIRFDLGSGTVIWKKQVGPYAGTRKHDDGLFDMDMHAAATPVTDGSRVYVMFANGDLACFDYDGSEIWGLNTGLPDIAYGYASSPVIAGGRLIVQLELKERSSIAAFDPATGRKEWESDRPHASWSTPAVCRGEDGREILICASTASLSAYDAGDGRQLWVVDDCMGGDVGSSAVCSGGMVYITSISGGVRAYRIGAAPELVWQWDEDPAEMASPLVVGGRVYIASGIGSVTCLDASDGKEKWHGEFEGEFYATPVYAAGRIYALTRAGVMHVLKDGNELVVEGSLPSGSRTDATPVMLDGRVIVRAGDELVCFGNQPQYAGEAAR